MPILQMGKLEDYGRQLSTRWGLNQCVQEVEYRCCVFGLSSEVLARWDPEKGRH